MLYNIEVEDIVFNQTLNDSSNFITLEALEGFHNVTLKTTSVQYPRTSNYNTVGVYQEQKVRTIGGTVLSYNQEEDHVIQNKIASLLYKKLRFTVKKYTKHLESSLYKTYYFDGIITDINFQPTKYGTNYNVATKYTISIVSDNPFIYDANETVFTLDLVPSGLQFPLKFPLNFGNPQKLEVINDSQDETYPVVEIQGQVSFLKIYNETTKQLFVYNNIVPLNQTAVLNPSEGTVIQNSFDVSFKVNDMSTLLLAKGVNNLSLSGGSISNSKVTFKLSNSYLII